MNHLNTPAFPTTTEHGFNNGVEGMWLRDYFAAKAMQGMLAMETHPVKFGISSAPYFALAESAYRMADAMMEARK
jgi:hypothetical protein